jgi:hypothetical protein
MDGKNRAITGFYSRRVLGSPHCTHSWVKGLSLWWVGTETFHTKHAATPVVGA